MSKGTKSPQSTSATLSRWNKFYSTKKFGIGVECSKCRKWRKVIEYEESYQVPEEWDCSMTTIDGEKGSCSTPSTLTSEDFVSEEYVPGSLVWAKYSGYPWWPAMVEDDPDEEEYYAKDEEGDEEYHVVFFADKPEKVRRAWIAAKHLVEYIKTPKRGHVKKSWITALRISKEIADSALPMSLPERLKKFSFANQKFPAAKKDAKVSKILAKKNGRGCPVSAIPSKRCRRASAVEDPINGAATKHLLGNTAEDSASVSASTIHEIGRNVEIAATVPTISPDHLPQTDDSSEESDPEGMAAFERELEQYSEEEGPPSSESSHVSVPEYLKNREIDELFSDCMTNSPGSEYDDMPAHVLEWDPDNPPEMVPEEQPVIEKYVHTSEEDIWDINNPNLPRSYIWNWKDLK